jgi:hypothetical protein
MEPSDERGNHLAHLASALAGSYGLVVRIQGTVAKRYLHVENHHGGAPLSADVLCLEGPDGWYFSWSSKQRIGPADDLTGVAARVMTVLRPVEGSS